jgi:hypothetical protein
MPSDGKSDPLTNMAAQAIHVYDCMLYKKKCFSVEREITLQKKL